MWILPLLFLANPPTEDALIERTHAISDAVAERRALPWLEPVEVSVFDEAELRERLQRELESDLDPESVARSTRALLAFGLVAVDYDLKAQLEATLGSQIAGFYDPETDELVLVNRDMAMVETVAEHELVHALQDQHFKLDELIQRDFENDDVVAAIKSLVEGDATYAMFATQFQRMGMDPDKMPLGPVIALGRASMKSEESMAGAPSYLVKGLVSQYLDGALFVQALRDGTWKPIDAAFAAPPLSTEQILHPEKYTGAEPDWPTLVQLPEKLHRRFGAGWKLDSENTVGELGVQILFEHHLPDQKHTNIHAGWDGDRYALFTRRKRPDALVWLTVWDTEEDAEEFASATEALLPILTRDDGRILRAERRVLVQFGGGRRAARVAMEVLTNTTLEEVRELDRWPVSADEE